jgi:predicted amidohydrolase YtcJ
MGMLEAGKDADLVVLSQDIFSIPHEEIAKTHALMTMVGGTAVFDEMPGARNSQ